MKKYFLFTLVVISLASYAQSFDFSVGYVPDGFGGSVNYNKYYGSIYSYLQIGLDVSFADAFDNEYKVPYNDLTLHAGYFYPLIQNPEATIQLAGGGGFIAGYEFIKKGDETLVADGFSVISESSFIYGGFLSGEVNVLLSKNIFIFGKYNQNFYLNSNLGPLSLYAGIGLRYYIDI